MNKHVLCAVAFFTLATASVFAQPKMEIVGGETYDWGRKVFKEKPLKMVTLEGNIVVKNTGNKDLIIDTIKVGCGCTTPHYTKDPIKPGQTANVGVGLNVGLNSGELTKTLTIYANDDPNKTGRLIYLKANIFRPLTLTPQSFNFPEITVGETTKSSITLKNNDTRAYQIDRILATGGVRLDKKGPYTLQPNDTLQIGASYTGSDRGYWNANVIIETNDPDYPPFEVSAYGQVKDKDGVVDPSVIKIDPTKAKDGKIELPAPGSTPTPVPAPAGSAAKPAPAKKGKK